MNKSYLIQAWPAEAITEFRIFALLQRTLLDPQFDLLQLANIGGWEYIQFTDRNQVMLHLAGKLVPTDLPLRVETSDDLIHFKTKNIRFSELSNFISASKALSLTYFPATYPTVDSFNADVNELYAKLYVK